MMNALIILGLIAAYFAGGGFIFGYLKASYTGYHEQDTNFLGALFWPVVATYLLCSKPLYALGFSMAENQLNKKRARIAIQQKIRVELEEAERQLDMELASNDRSLSKRTR